MIKNIILKYFILPCVIVLLLTQCKKESYVKLRVFNPYTQKNVKGCFIVIQEQHRSNFFTSGWGRTYDKLTDIASGTTDENGEVIYTNLKLKNSDNYVYRYYIKEIWGSSKLSFEPGTYSKLEKGSPNNFVISDYTKGTLNLIIQSLFIPGNSGDSLQIVPKWNDLYDPEQKKNIQGSGIETMNFTFDYVPGIRGDFSSNGYPEHACGRVKLLVRKRKLGNVTLDSIDVQFYPKETTTVTINW